jgi:hypothetical protein
VAKDHPELIPLFTKKLQRICLHRPQQQKYWLTFDLELETLLPFYAQGDCSMNEHVKESECRFQHPYLPDNFDPNTLPLVNGKVGTLFFIFLFIHLILLLDNVQHFLFLFIK